MQKKLQVLFKCVQYAHKYFRDKYLGDIKIPPMFFLYICCIDEIRRI
jgi:hypothetical protein